MLHHRYALLSTSWNVHIKTYVPIDILYIENVLLNLSLCILEIIYSCCQGDLNIKCYCFRSQVDIKTYVNRLVRHDDSAVRYIPLFVGLLRTFTWLFYEPIPRTRAYPNPRQTIYGLETIGKFGYPQILVYKINTIIVMESRLFTVKRVK